MVNDSIISVIERTGVVLNKTGSVYSGLCPLHKDVGTPSLKVYPETNSWCCFGAGCGNKYNGKLNGGNPVDWVMQKLQLDYNDAINWITGTGTQTNLLQLSKKIKKEKNIPEKLVHYWHSLLDKCNRRNYYYTRGFDDKFIDFEMWGWDGKRYVIPVWLGEPNNSECEGVRLRASDLSDSIKYRGLKDHNKPTVWGRWHCRKDNIVLGFAGEFDAARAVQDGLGAFSLVNGANAFNRFPKNWPALWFPQSEFLLVIFDKKEEVQAGKLALSWIKIKGPRTAKVLLWPPTVNGKDYCDFRDSGRTVGEFKKLIISQLERK